MRGSVVVGIAITVSHACGAATAPLTWWNVDSDPQEGADEGAGASSGDAASGDGSSDTKRSPVCPVSAPTAGAKCLEPTLVQCEYGTNPNPFCNAVWRCFEGKWTQTTDPKGGSNYCPPASTCPASAPSTGNSCADVETYWGLVCTYPDSDCDCYKGDRVGDTAQWFCQAAPAGCPEPRPNLGNACSSDGLTCNYGPCPQVEPEVCTGGYWQQGARTCELPP